MEKRLLLFLIEAHSNILRISSNLDKIYPMIYTMIDSILFSGSVHIKKRSGINHGCKVRIPVYPLEGG